MSAQIIDDKLKKTLVSASSIEKEIKAKIKKMEKSTLIGEILGKEPKKILMKFILIEVKINITAE